MRIRSLLAGILAASLASAAFAQTAPISGLPAPTTPLTGSELFPCYQGTKVAKCSVSNVLGGNASTATAWATGQTFSLSGDCATASPPTVNGTASVTIPATCTKTNGTAFGYFATGTSAANLTGTLGAAQLPAFSGDCTTSPGTTALTCTKTNGTAFGTFATANAATPPAIGGTTPAAGSFTTLSASGLITPSSTAGIKGTTAADNAQAGSVGEFISNSGSSVALTNGVVANGTSLSLTAGDWVVQCNVLFTPSGTTTYTIILAGLNTTSATLTYAPDSHVAIAPGSGATGQYQSLLTPAKRFSVAAATTVYCPVQAYFGTSTMAAAADIWARRVR